MRTRFLVAAIVVTIVSGCADDESRPLADIDRPARPMWCPSGVGPDGKVRTHGDLDGRKLLGQPLEQARAVAATSGCEVRVLVEEGRELDRDDDWRVDRINVEVRSGIVVALIDVY